MMRLPTNVAFMLLLLLGAGCKKSEASARTRADPAGPKAEASSAAAVAPSTPADEARGIFKAKCVMCHGNQGNGDGPAASALTPKPRSFSDPAWQAKVTDDQLKKVVIEGGAAVGLSGSMPSNPELNGKDDVVAELIKLLRGFKR